MKPTKLERWLSGAEYARFRELRAKRVRAAKKASATRAYRYPNGCRTKTRAATADELAQFVAKDYGLGGRLVTPVDRSVETVDSFGQCLLPRAFGKGTCLRKDFHHCDVAFPAYYEVPDRA